MTVMELIITVMVKLMRNSKPPNVGLVVAKLKALVKMALKLPVFHPQYQPMMQAVTVKMMTVMVSLMKTLSLAPVVRVFVPHVLIALRVPKLRVSHLSLAPLKMRFVTVQMMTVMVVLMKTSSTPVVTVFVFAMLPVRVGLFLVSLDLPAKVIIYAITSTKTVMVMQMRVSPPRRPVAKVPVLQPSLVLKASSAVHRLSLPSPMIHLVMALIMTVMVKLTKTVM